MKGAAYIIAGFYLFLLLSLILFSFVPRDALALTYQEHDHNSNCSTSYTFTGESIGTAASDRDVLVQTYAESDEVDTMTIGGVTATLIATSTYSGDRLGLYAAVVPTGTTANIVVNFASGAVACAVGIYTDNNLSLFPISWASGGASGSSPSASVSITIPTSGIVIAGSSNDNNVLVTNDSWTGVTKQFAVDVRSDSHHSGGMNTAPTPGPGFTVSNSQVSLGFTDLGILAVSMSYSTTTSGGGGATTTATSTASTAGYSPSQQEWLFMFGLLVFLLGMIAFRTIFFSV